MNQHSNCGTMPAMSKGKLKQNGVHLMDHEYKTVKYFLERGIDIELIPRSNIKGFHAGDFIMNGLAWETKAPIGRGKKNVENIIQIAAQQSENIIIDLRRSKMPEERAIKEFQNRFHNCKGARQLKIITKSEELLDFRK